MMVLEHSYWQREMLVAGVDEAGRGALAGPVVVAAVILPPGNYPYRDSKKLSPRQRELMLDHLLQKALAWSVASASATMVDQRGVLRATYSAAYAALSRLHQRPDAVITDYLFLSLDLPLQAPSHAEELSPNVAAASILAKVVRDRHMQGLHMIYPQYNFAAHKGYGTAKHLEALRQYGPCPAHRRRFAPVSQASLWD